jgi:hypothetical protein
MSNGRKVNKANDELYTQQWIFEALRLQFDLDPAHPDQKTNVPCTRYFTEEINGLKQDWKGLVWLNPPFRNPKEFIEKFIKHNNGIALVGMSRSKAFKDLWENAAAIVLLPSQLKFDNSNGKTQTIFMPCVLVAMGDKGKQALTNSGIGKVR